MRLDETDYRQALEETFIKEAWVSTLARGAYTMAKGLGRTAAKKQIKDPFLKGGWQGAKGLKGKTWAATKGGARVAGSAGWKGLTGAMAYDSIQRARRGEISTGQALAEVGMLGAAGGLGTKYFKASAKPIEALSKRVAKSRPGQAISSAAQSKSLLKRTAGKTVRTAGKATAGVGTLGTGFAAWELGARAGDTLLPYKLKKPAQYRVDPNAPPSSKKLSKTQAPQYAVSAKVRTPKEDLPK